MFEVILYRGNMPTAFFSRDSVDAAISSGQYRRTPLNAVVVDTLTKAPSPNAIDVNSASLASLQSINGIGISRAREIIEERPYSTVEDLIAVTTAVDWLKLEESEVIYIGPAQ